MANKALKDAVARYDATHTKQIHLKLNLATDADILNRLDEVGNKQGYIKELIRKDLEKCWCTSLFLCFSCVGCIKFYVMMYKKIDIAKIKWYNYTRNERRWINERFI